MHVKHSIVRPKRALALLLLALVPWGSVACDQQLEAQAPPKQIELARHVEKLLELSPEVDVRRIRVHAESHGHVVLEGEVDTLLARTEAVSLARITPGVREVEDRLELDAPQRSDAILTSRLRRRLMLEPDLHGIDATVAGGVAILSGKVPEPEDAKVARRIASAVPGVRSVVDRTFTPPVTVRASLYANRRLESELM